MAGGRVEGQGGRGGRTAFAEDVYERDEVAREAQMEEGLQRIEAALRAITQRIEALEVA
jgi:hypothetical protein